MVQEESRGNTGGVTAARDRVTRDTGTTDIVTTGTGTMATIMTEAGATEAEDGVGAEEDSEVAEVTEAAGSSYREAGPSLISPRVETFSPRMRTEAGAEGVRESTICTRGSCSNTGQVRVKVMRRIRWSMAVKIVDPGQDPDHDL